MYCWPIGVQYALQIENKNKRKLNADQSKILTMPTVSSVWLTSHVPWSWKHLILSTNIWTVSTFGWLWMCASLHLALVVAENNAQCRHEWHPIQGVRKLRIVNWCAAGLIWFTRFGHIFRWHPKHNVATCHTESAVAWVTVCKCNQTCCPAGSKTAHGGEMSAKRATSSRE